MVNYCQWFIGGLEYIQASGLSEAEQGQCVSDYGRVVFFSIGKWSKKVHVHGERKKKETKKPQNKTRNNPYSSIPIAKNCI